MDIRSIRKALLESQEGRSGRYVYAMRSTNGEWFRITNVKTHRGLTYGYRLSDGKWYVVGKFEER